MGILYEIDKERDCSTLLSIKTIAKHRGGRCRTRPNQKRIPRVLVRRRGLRGIDRRPEWTGCQHVYTHTCGCSFPCVSSSSFETQTQVHLLNEDSCSHPPTQLGKSALRILTTTRERRYTSRRACSASPNFGVEFSAAESSVGRPRHQEHHHSLILPSIFTRYYGYGFRVPACSELSYISFDDFM